MIETKQYRNEFLNSHKNAVFYSRISTTSPLILITLLSFLLHDWWILLGIIFCYVGQLLSMSRVWLFVFLILTIVYAVTYGFHLKNYINIYFLCFLYGDITFSLSNLFIKRLDETKLKIEKEVEKGLNKTDLALLYYKTGFESLDKNNFKDAIENFTKSIDILKDLPKDEENEKLLRELFYNRGNCKDELKEYSEAIDNYNLAIEYGGENKDESEFLNRGLAKFEMGFYEDAINDYNQVIEINPKNAKAYFGRGNAKYKDNYKDGACNDWKESEKLGFEYASKMIENYCK